MGYLPPTPEFDAAVEDLRAQAARPHEVATTFGYGPRFLHSTGQLHKGGPPTGRFLQLVHDADDDVAIPGGDRRPSRPSSTRRRSATCRRCATTACRRCASCSAATPSRRCAPSRRTCNPMAQIGFVGLGKMGGNMVHRIQRDSDHEVVAFDFDEAAVDTAAEGHGATGATSLEDLVEQARGAAHRLDHGPRRRPDRADGRQARRAAREGDTIVDGGNSQAGPTTCAAPRSSTKPASTTSTSARRGGVWGLEVGYCMMVGGPDESVERLTPILDVLAPPPDEQHGRLGPHRPDRRRPLREDGPQRRRVRDDAGLRRGLRAVRRLASSTSTTRRSRTSGCSGSVVRSWLCELAARAFEQEGNDLDGARARTSRTPARAAGRRGRDRQATCPTPVITAALFARFYSRGHGDFAAQGASRRCATSSAATRSSAEPTARRRMTSWRPRTSSRAGARAENPLVEGLERLPVHPTTLVIFGATGDLARRKLLPAIYNLAHEGALPERFNLIGVSRRDMADDDFREHGARVDRSSSRAARPTTKVLEELLGRRPLRLGHRSTTDGVYAQARRARSTSSTRRPASRSTASSTCRPRPSSSRSSSSSSARTASTATTSAEVRVVIEKPFGTDLESAPRAQPRRVLAVLRRAAGLPHRPLPGQGDRPEHAGVPVRELHVRADLEPQLHRPRRRSPRPRTSASARRAGYYDHAGALRDLVQNHMLQLLTLLCMEPPASLRGRQGARREGQGAATRSRRRRPSRSTR